MANEESIRKRMDNETGLQLPPEILQAIQEVFPSEDPLDQPEFNVVDYINTLFPTEQSLSSIDEMILNVKGDIRDLDVKIRGTLRSQTDAGGEGQRSLKEAQGAITQLFVQIKDIKQKAEISEEMVKEITSDIKQLDNAKKHLTASVTTLNHLHMLVGGVDTLESLQSRRQYGEIANLLQGLTHVLDHFEKYLVIPEIRQLADRLSKIKQEIGIQLLSDFRAAFTSTSAKQSTPSQQLADACRVVSVLDPKIKKELLTWFINMQLSEYVVLFQESQDNAWLDKLDRRYNWLKLFLVDFEKRFGAMFPTDWDLSRRITTEFCEISKNELQKVMTNRRHEIDVNLIVHAIQRTMVFENFLSKRFPGPLLEGKDSISLGVQSSGWEDRSSKVKVTDYPDEKNPFESGPDTSKDETRAAGISQNSLNPFLGMISQCFLPFMDIYIESKDRNISELLDKFIEDFKTRGVPKPSDAAIQEGSLSIVLPSCANLFVFYKKCMQECDLLSYNGQSLVQLSTVFRKYLKSYATRLLIQNLPKSTTISISAATTGLIQSFLKEGDASGSRLTEEEIRRICSILTTAEYCCETIQQLEDKLKEKVGPVLAQEINFSLEQEIFNSVVTSSIQLLVNDLENACEPAMTAMTKRQWQSVEVVGDQSGFVTAILGHLRAMLPILRNYLSSSRKYFTQFCIKFVSSFIPRYIMSIYKCRPISTVGAEQLLLDTHMLKTVLLDLPSLNSQISRRPPSSFTKIVTKGLTRAEMILKVVMAPHDVPKIFVEKFVQLLPESDTADLQKILEMKGIKRSDQTSFLECYRNFGPSSSQTQLHSDFPASSLGEPESGRIKKLEMLKERFMSTLY